MEKKTIDEIKKDVFAYCQQIGSDGDFLIRDRLWLFQDFDGFTCQRQNKANQGTQVFAVNPNLDADDPHWAVAYAVLGLSERDAVEAERAEMMKTVDALSAMVSVDPVSFAELEAKNAALVAALEGLKQKFGFNTFLNPELTGGGSHRHINSVGLEISRILQLNKEGVSHEN